MSTIKAMKSLSEKYGEGILSMAMSYLFYSGKDKIENADIELMVREVLKQSDEKVLLTSDVQEKVLRCAKEMSELDMNEILRYIKTDYRMFGVTTQEGRIIEFLTNGTEEHVLYVVVPSETQDEAIDEATCKLTQAIEDYDKAHDGDFAEFDAKQVIYDAMRQAKITPRPLDVSMTVYI